MSESIFFQHPQLHDGGHLAMRVTPMPKDTNPAGDIFGGWIMAQVDLAGGLYARRVAKGRVATVAVNSFVFKHPVSVGDLLSFYTTEVRRGTTSVTVSVEVFAERDPATSKACKVTEAQLTYVAVDDDGKKRPLPA